MALNKIGDAVSASIGSWFQVDAKSPPGKAAKSEGSARSEGAKRSSSPCRNPFSGVQSQWLEHALTGALTEFGRNVAEEMQRIETKVNFNHTATCNVDSKVEELRKELLLEMQRGTGLGSARVALDNKVAELEAAVTKLTERLEAGTAPSHSAAASSCSAPAAPRKSALQLRTAFMGNLGWGNSSEDLLARGRNILAKVGVQVQDMELHAQVHRDGKGSGIVVLFPDDSQLELAAVRVRTLRRSFTTGKMVWLAEQRTREELIPGRILRRLHEVLEGQAAKMEAKPKVRYKINELSLSVDGKLAAWIENEQVQWDAEASTTFSEEQLKRAKGLAEICGR